MKAILCVFGNRSHRCFNRWHRWSPLKPNLWERCCTFMEKRRRCTIAGITVHKHFHWNRNSIVLFSKFYDQLYHASGSCTLGALGCFWPRPRFNGETETIRHGDPQGGILFGLFYILLPSPPRNPLFPILLRHFISLLTPAPSSLAKYRNFTYRHFYFLNKTLILQVRGFQHPFPGRLQLHLILYIRVSHFGVIFQNH